jgi:hypothetical protein
LAENLQQDITKEIAVPKSRSKVWRLLNSPFGIWCLSSVILASITAGWTLFHTWLLEHKQDKQKRTALAYEISVRASDFLVKCRNSQSPNELRWHLWEFQGAQDHLTQFRAATMDELTFQYRLLSGKQDAVVANALDNAGSNFTSAFDWMIWATLRGD